VSAAPARLPRGRHRLSREEVVRSQRERMLRAMAQTTARKGYVATTVADVLSAAGVSRETFYEQFKSKEDCFAHALDAAAQVLLAGVAEAQGDEGEPLDRLDRTLRVYLDTLAAESDFARLFLVEVYAAGPEALARRVAVQRAFADLVVAGLDARTADDRFACEGFVAATSSMVTTRLAANDLDGLRALHRPLLRLADRLLAGADQPSRRNGGA
jgi:AcrR family transcriptional regulator